MFDFVLRVTLVDDAYRFFECSKQALYISYVFFCLPSQTAPRPPPPPPPMFSPAPPQYGPGFQGGFQPQQQVNSIYVRVHMYMFVRVMLCLRLFVCCAVIAVCAYVRECVCACAYLHVRVRVYMRVRGCACACALLINTTTQHNRFSFPVSFIVSYCLFLLFFLASCSAGTSKSSCTR